MSLTFDPSSFITKTVTCGGLTVTSRAYERIPYCEHPKDADMQRLSIFVNEDMAEGKTVGGYTLANAPIFMPNTVGGYMPGPIEEPGENPMRHETNASFFALLRGYVVVSPGIRGRGMKNAAGEYIGTAPAHIVDYKAAVRYLKANRGRIPGDPDRIISNGTSAGGALSCRQVFCGLYGSQVCGFGAGDKVTMGQLVRCLLVYSGNDAASAIAEHIGGTTENFVDMMNSYAAQLGCTGTHFSNPHGLQDENHYTTPYDIYLMLKGALNYPSFTEITQLPSYTVEYTKADGSTMSTVLEATDHYLTGEVATPKDVKILGGKTGTTSLAGNCLALLCQNAYGQPYIAIIMGASSKELLYQEMTSLLQHIN